MNFDFSAAMRQAPQLTRAQNVMEATRVIQRALTGRRPRPARRSRAARFRAPAPHEPEASSETAPQAADAVEPPQQARDGQLERCRDGATPLRARDGGRWERC